MPRSDSEYQEGTRWGPDEGLETAHRSQSTGVTPRPS